jgi:hypothetical protein
VGVLVVRLGPAQYVTWSTTVDAPVGRVMSRAELIHHLVEVEEQISHDQATHLLDVAEANGTSDPEADLGALVQSNRAGPYESRLTVEEIVHQYR